MLLPPVSIIIPTYNYAHYICDAISSVLKQNYPIEQLEIIVVDDGSTDNTKEILQPFIDKRIIRYYYQPNKGKASATRHAIEKSNGKYIFNLDADDYYFPGKIANYVELFECDDKLVHVASPAKIFYQETGCWGEEKLPQDVLGNYMDGNWLLERFYNSNILYGGGSTYAARASVLKTIEIPDAVDMYIDEFLILAVLPFGKSYLLNESQSVWRVHSSNYSGRTSIKESMVKKAERLLLSSGAVLRYLEQKKFNDKLIKIYRLRDAIRRISFKEMVNLKKTRDIICFTNEVFFCIRPGWKVIMKYDVVNRLIPTQILGLLKKVRYVLFR